MFVNVPPGDCYADRCLADRGAVSFLRAEAYDGASQVRTRIVRVFLLGPLMRCPYVMVYGIGEAVAAQKFIVNVAQRTAPAGSSTPARPSTPRIAAIA